MAPEIGLEGRSSHLGGSATGVLQCLLQVTELFCYPEEPMSSQRTLSHETTGTVPRAFGHMRHATIAVIAMLLLGVSDSTRTKAFAQTAQQLEAQRERQQQAEEQRERQQQQQEERERQQQEQQEQRERQQQAQQEQQEERERQQQAQQEQRERQEQQQQAQQEQRERQQQEQQQAAEQRERQQQQEQQQAAQMRERQLQQGQLAEQQRQLQQSHPVTGVSVAQRPPVYVPSTSTTVVVTRPSAPQRTGGVVVVAPQVPVAAGFYARAQAPPAIDAADAQAAAAQQQLIQAQMFQNQVNQMAARDQTIDQIMDGIRTIIADTTTNPDLAQAMTDSIGQPNPIQDTLLQQMQNLANVNTTRAQTQAVRAGILPASVLTPPPAPASDGSSNPTVDPGSPDMTGSSSSDNYVPDPITSTPPPQ